MTKHRGGQQPKAGEMCSHDPAPPQTERRPHQPPAPQGRSAGRGSLVVPGWIRGGLRFQFTHSALDNEALTGDGVVAKRGSNGKVQEEADSD